MVALTIQSKVDRITYPKRATLPGSPLPLHFISGAITGDSMNTTTKAKQNAYSRRYYATHKEQKRLYYETHKDKIKAQHKIYRETHRKEYNTQMKAYRDTHKDECRLQSKRYYENHPEVTVRSDRKRRALKYGNIHEPYIDRDIFGRDNWICGVCGRKINKCLKYPHPHSKSIDHIIPLSKGGTDAPVNVQGAHLRCNQSKHNKAAKELFGEFANLNFPTEFEIYDKENKLEQEL